MFKSDWIIIFIFRFVEIYSLPRNCRLHKAAEFAAIINLRRQASSRLIQVYMRPNEFAYARLGLIVSKKIERSAVKRNWIKRLLREIFRKSRHDEQIKKMDWIIRLRRPVARDELKQLVIETKSVMLQLQRCHG